jgi:putative component of toxin-antitoxin plasmid stabilization module
MNAVANLKGLPDTQWKDVTPVKESVKEYEIKAGDLRMFVIKIPYGKLVVLGGYKNNQKEDFKKFRSLKAQYLSNH